jgi:hypothetical protein
MPQVKRQTEKSAPISVQPSAILKNYKQFQLRISSRVCSAWRASWLQSRINQKLEQTAAPPVRVQNCFGNPNKSNFPIADLLRSLDSRRTRVQRMMGPKHTLLTGRPIFICVDFPRFAGALVQAESWSRRYVNDGEKPPAPCR